MALTVRTFSFLSLTFQHSQRVRERQDKRHSPEEHHQKVGDCLESSLQPHGLAPCPKAAPGRLGRTGTHEAAAESVRKCHNSPNVSAALKG